MPMIEILRLICGTTTKTPSCYSRKVCGTCAAKAPDELKRALKFFNTSIGGGFIAYHADSYQVETHPGYLCLIDDIRCCANGARFGGIVIQTLTDQPEQRLTVPVHPASEALYATTHFTRLSRISLASPPVH